MHSSSPWLESLDQDVRHALRSLRRAPSFSIIAVLTLAVGIGINAAVFAVADAVLFRGFASVPANDRILYIDTQKDGRGCCVSHPDFADWRAQAASFEGLGAVADLQIIVGDTNSLPERYDATLISADAFELLGQRPVVGRNFTSLDETPGAPPVAILRYDFWKRRYGQDPAVIGKTIRINGTPTTVIGVMPPGFSFPQNQQLWMPLVPTPDFQKRDARRLWFAFGRMKDGVTFASARAELETIGTRLAAAYPRTNQDWVPQPRTFAEFFVGRNAPIIYRAMWGAVAFVLLIACANLANLMLARAIGRSREISVRIAMGAGRWRVVRQLLVESLMLSAAGGAVGWWIATWSVRAYERLANPPTLSWSENLIAYAIDGRVLVYLLAMSIATGLLFAVVPAFRLSKLDVNAALKEGSRGTTGSRRDTHLSRVLVVAEIALAIVLLAGAGVMVRSFLNISRANLGVDTGHVITMFLNLPEARYPRDETRVAFYDRLETRLAAIPGVESVAIVSSLPAGGSQRVSYELAGATPLDEERRPTASALTIGPGYFRTLGATVVSGRDFTGFDDGSGVSPVIVNQRFASTHWPGAHAIGKRLRLFDGATRRQWSMVVGVVSNIVQSDATRQEFEALVYLPYRALPAESMWVMVRTRARPASLAMTFRREIQALDPDLPIWLGPYTLDDRLAGMGNYWSISSKAVLFVIFAAVALLLASVGLYAVIAHSVSLRTQEIGVRMAVGATARDILRLVIVQGMRPLAIGLAIGLTASVAVNRVLTSMLVHVSPADPISLAGACGVLMVAAALGCLMPALRAARVDPVIALRHE